MATYLNGTLVPKGELLENYYATGHVSLDNYIAEISGQAPTPLTDSDCNLTGFSNITPGTDDPNTATYPGQVDGNGCVYPASVLTLADQMTSIQRSRLNRVPGGAALRDIAALSRNNICSDVR